MIVSEFLHRLVDPALTFGFGITQIPVTDKARVLVMTIAGQESHWQYRRQLGGPARSYWQFEKFGGVAGLFSVTPRQLRAVCDVLDIPYDIGIVYEAMAWNDTLACNMARLLLWSDPAPLPPVGDKAGSWNYYLRLWLPGLPHPETWDARYGQSLSAMGIVT